MTDAKKGLRGGIGGETVVITAVEERPRPQPEARPGRVKATRLPREVNTLTADEADRDVELTRGKPAAEELSPEEVEAATRTYGDGTPTTDTAEHAALHPGDTVEIPTVTRVESPVFLDPAETAARSALRARLRKVAVVCVLAIPVASFALTLWAMPLMTALYVLGGTAFALVFVGPMIKDAIENGLFKFVTAKLWIEAVAAVAIVFGLLWTSGIAWEWCVSVTLAALVVRSYVQAVQIVRAMRCKPVVVEVREEIAADAPPAV
jgi:hypothetical protein